MPIEPDTGLLFAADRAATGANAHKINNACHNYKWLCYAGEKSRAQEAAWSLARLLGMLALEQAAVGSADGL
jgi:hypothetical protein